jgi:ribosomal protein S18 acetylase RimI-like enzyme
VVSKPHLVNQTDLNEWQLSMLIRACRKADVSSISRVYVQTWQDTYLGILPFGYLYSMSVGQLERGLIDELKSRQMISYVAEEAGKLVGFIRGGYERNGDPIYDGEIYELYVLRDHQRQGVGSELVSALVAQFNHLGIYSMLVQVLDANPYRRFYEKINGIYLRSSRIPFAGEVLDAAVYGWIDTGLVHYYTA